MNKCKFALGERNVANARFLVVAYTRCRYIHFGMANRATPIAPLLWLVLFARVPPELSLCTSQPPKSVFPSSLSLAAPNVQHVRHRVERCNNCAAPDREKSVPAKWSWN